MVRERPLKLRNDPIPALGEGLAGLAVLAGTAFAAWALQFFTGLFETWPALGTAVAAGELFLGAGVALQGLREARASRRFLHLAAGCSVAIAAGWILQAKISYPGTLLSHPRYTAPHMPFPYGNGARLVRLTCADGVGIDGMYLAGQQTSALILYPGWISGKDGLAIASLARWLAPHFQVLVLDPRGSGGSGGFQRSGDGKLDISAAAAFLHDKGATRIGVLAEGDGSLAAALAAAEDPAINALLLAGPTATWGEPRPGDSGWDDPRSALGRLYWRVAAGIRLAGASGPALADVLPKVAPRPLLIVSHPGEAARVAQRLFLAASEPRGLRLLPGSGRPLDWGAYPAYLGAVRDWFRLVLAPDTGAGTNNVSALTEAVGGAGTMRSHSFSEAASVPSAPGSGGIREARATASPEELELKALLGEPQPLVPALPGLPTHAVEARAASAAAQVPVLPAPPVAEARPAEGPTPGRGPASGQPAPEPQAAGGPGGVMPPSRAAAP